MIAAGNAYLWLIISLCDSPTRFFYIQRPVAVALVLPENLVVGFVRIGPKAQSLVLHKLN